MIKKIKGKYVVMSETTGRSFGSYRTVKEAKKRLRQMEFFKHLGKSPRMKKALHKKRFSNNMRKSKLRWKRILLKLSGETLSGKGESGLDIHAVEYIAREVKSVHDLGCEMALVIGGGNFIRGEKLSKIGIDRTTADYMGMLGTIINALALQSTLEHIGLFTRVMSTITAIQVSEPFIRRRAIRHLEKGRVVIFAGGTGNPYFSTDTAAALRASEINAEAILKATNVEGVYEEDPKKNGKAKLLKSIDPADVVRLGLKVMDLTAVTLAMENNLPVTVFNVFKKGNLARLLSGEKIGSEIK